jgi:hypothetical protein
MYNAAEKSLLSVAFIPCAVLQAIIYWFAKRSIKSVSETTEKRMETWFSAMSGIMLGIFVFRTLPQAASIIIASPFTGWSYRSLAAFVMMGFYVLMWVDKMSRVWPSSPVYRRFPFLCYAASLNTKKVRRSVARRIFRIHSYRRIARQKANGTNRLSGHDQHW